MLATASLFVTILVIALVVGFFRPDSSNFVLILLVFSIPYIVCQYTLTAQRLRDMNATGWLALLWAPANMADSYLNGAASFAFWIILCVIPGTEGENRYGQDPLKSLI